jgi:hypothetical protein
MWVRLYNQQRAGVKGKVWNSLSKWIIIDDNVYEYRKVVWRSYSYHSWSAVPHKCTVQTLDAEPVRDVWATTQENSSIQAKKWCEDYGLTLIDKDYNESTIP